MGNYDELKQAVAEVIKTNGNQEITGEVLQNTLLSIISNVGNYATFAGIAKPDTNPGTPDNNVFYIAIEAGNYVNFGSTSDFTLNGKELGIFANKTNQWTCEKLSFAGLLFATKTLTYAQLDTIGLENLDAADIIKLASQAASGAPLRYHVTYSEESPAEGLLEVWFDTGFHVVTEILTTSAVLNQESQEFSGTHTDFTQNTYIRYLNINAPSSPVGQMQWTNWHIYESSDSNGYKFIPLDPNNPINSPEKMFGIINGGDDGVTLANYTNSQGVPIVVEPNTIGLIISQWDRLKQKNNWLKGTLPFSRAGIDIRNIKFSQSMTQLSLSQYDDYSKCEADTSRSEIFNNKTFNPLKLTNLDEEEVKSNLWGWGDFIISQGKLKNQSPGARTLAITRQMGNSGLVSAWHNGDKIIITRTSSEPITIETAPSTIFKLTTSGLTDTINVTVGSDIATDTVNNSLLLLSIPRETYIKSIEIQQCRKVIAVISYMDGRHANTVYFYKNPANGDTLNQFVGDLASLETKTQNIETKANNNETAISQLKTAGNDVNVSDVDVVPNKDNVDVTFKDINHSDEDGFFSDDKSFRINAATQEAAGVMSADDKKKIDAIKITQLGTQYCIKKRMPLVENNVLYLYKYNIPIKLGNETLVGKKIKVVLDFDILQIREVKCSVTWGDDEGKSTGEFYDGFVTENDGEYSFDFTNFQNFLDTKQITKCHVLLLIKSITMKEFLTEVYKAYYVIDKGLKSNGYHLYHIKIERPIKNDMQLQNFNIINNTCYLNNRKHEHDGFITTFEKQPGINIKVYRKKNVKRIDLSQGDIGCYKNSTYGKRKVSGYFNVSSYNNYSYFWRGNQKHTLKCLIKQKRKVCNGFVYQHIISKPIYGIFTCNFQNDGKFRAVLIK